MKDRRLKMDHITLGVCYYPEHWPEDMWQADLQEMKRCGIEVIRIAEFAWNKFEPQEGVYTFDFFDRFMEVAEKENMKVIFCTPTATPPLWLTEKYPEVLNADLDGNTYYHGTRRHYNLTSPVYREFSRKITEKLAEHYVNHPRIIGWQLDNEINCEMDVYYSESDHTAFRRYMKKKYETLERLNEAMGTVFWNQTYTDWEQVHLTRRTNTYGQTNPHFQLEEKRFIAASAAEFFHIQSEVIRKWQKKYGREDQFITTNGLFRHIDYQQVVDESMDFITFDNYPAFAYENILVPEQTNGMKDRNSSQMLARTRSISPVFGIMEQQSGAGGWNCRMMMPMPKPGQMRLWSLQAIAHGADFVSYFRWRTATVGTEIYWHGLHDYDNRENRRVRELIQTAETVKKISPYVTGQLFRAPIAILIDYDNEWDGENDIWHGPLREKSMDGLFCALQKTHIPYDLVNLREDVTPEDLARYQVAFYPHSTIFTKRQKEVLEKAVEMGLTLLFGCRSGYKDETGRCYTMPMPGYVGELTGCQVEEYTYVSHFDTEVCIAWQDKQAGAREFHDVLEVTDGQVEAVFSGRGCHYDGKPAIVFKKTGKGCAYYVGTIFTEELARMIVETMELTKLSPAYGEIKLPETVELCRRGDVTFLLNYEETPARICLKERKIDLLTGEEVQGEAEIPARDVKILK